MRAPTPLMEPVLPAQQDELVCAAFGEQGHHVVEDPRSGAYFKLGPEESFLFSRLDGRRTVAETCAPLAATSIKSTRGRGPRTVPDDCGRVRVFEDARGAAGTPGHPYRSRCAPLPKRTAHPDLTGRPSPQQPQPRPRVPDPELNESKREPKEGEPAIDPVLAEVGVRPRRAVQPPRTPPPLPLDAQFLRRLRRLHGGGGGVVLLNRRELVGDLPWRGRRVGGAVLVWLTLVAATTCTSSPTG